MLPLVGINAMILLENKWIWMNFWMELERKVGWRNYCRQQNENGLIYPTAMKEYRFHSLRACIADGENFSHLDVEMHSSNSSKIGQEVIFI